MCRIFPICLLLIASLLIGPAAAAQDVGISFERAVKVGDKFKITSEGTDVSTEKVVIGGSSQPDQVNKMAAKLIGVIEITEVDSDGFATKANLELDEFTLTTAAGSTNPLQDKKSISIEKTDSGNKFIDDEGEISDAAVNRMLQLLYGMPSGDSDLQSFYATKDRKNVGNTWPISIDALIKSIQKGGVDADENSVGGACEIKSEIEVEGIPCFVVYGSIGASQLKIPPGQAPRGMTINRASFGSEFTATLPKDGITPMIAFENRASQEIQMRGRMGKELILAVRTVKADRIVKRQITQIKGE